ncbi:MAG: hypothetical protein LBJ69_00940 [Holosporales bacterium]|jgi:hypothetical protein|nr:hypothetical protein [Holosporales bacterium]
MKNKLVTSTLILGLIACEAWSSRERESETPVVERGGGVPVPVGGTGIYREVARNREEITQLKAKLAQMEKLLGYPAVVQEPEPQAEEEPEDEAGAPGGNAPIVAATPTVIPATGLYLHIENLLCPYIEQQRLRWDLKEWALLPDWLTELIATRLHGKRITIERHGRAITTPFENNGKFRWLLYAEVSSSNNFDRLIAVSKSDWVIAYAAAYVQEGTGNTWEVDSAKAQFVLAAHLRGISTMQVGTVADRCHSVANSDTKLKTLLDTFSIIKNGSDPTTNCVTDLPTLCINYNDNLAMGRALLKIDVLPEG